MSHARRITICVGPTRHTATTPRERTFDPCPPGHYRGLLLTRPHGTTAPTDDNGHDDDAARRIHHDAVSTRVPVFAHRFPGRRVPTGCSSRIILLIIISSTYTNTSAGETFFFLSSTKEHTVS